MFNAYRGYSEQQFFGGGMALLELQRTAGDWFDNAVGRNLDNFSRSQPISPAGLVREINVAIAGLSEQFVAKDKPRLEALLAIAEKIIAHDKAIKAVEKAIKHAHAIGVDPYLLRESKERAEREGTNLFNMRSA